VWRGKLASVNRRLRIAFFALLFIVAGLVAWFILDSREPKYQDRTVSEWLRELERRQNSSTNDWKEAAEAIRHIGPKALPVLVRKVKAHDPEWKVEAVDTVRTAFSWDLNESLAAVHHQRAMLGFHVLGRDAEPAIPKLASLAMGSDIEAASTAFAAMTEIGGPKVIPPLLQALTNGNKMLRSHAALALGSLRSQGAVAVSALAKALEEPDVGLQANAARALRDIGLEPDIAIPALVRALTNFDPRVSGGAAGALAVFGSRAESALPQLRTIPNGPDEFANRSVARAIVRVQCEVVDGGVIRGPKSEKKIALVFTGHEFGEGGETILNELTNHNGKGSFFVTGVFMSNPKFAPLLDRIVAEGHYLGPHSDQHLLYCAWEKSKPTLVSEDEFTQDLLANIARISTLGYEERRFSRYFLPPYEHYNREIYDWTRKLRRNLVNYTPGTRSNADYTGEVDKNFVSSQAIFDSIVKKDAEDPHGLNGFILLLHLGSGPGRADKFHTRFGELLDYLAGKGYQFVRVDDLLEPNLERPSQPAPLPGAGNRRGLEGPRSAIRIPR
jgi:peptidoglycan/xylan/chitin deacetylase (PgdA/CDA1 family)/HEAT repeat protein